MSTRTDETDILDAAPETNIASDLAAFRDASTPVDSDPDRCPFVNDHYRRTMSQMRDDGWRCGRNVHGDTGHVLYSSGGESVLDYMGPWDRLRMRADGAVSPGM